MLDRYWWMANWLSRVLEPAERDAVLGDLAESHESGLEAVRDVMGLAARRQAALWRNWQPWLALMGLIAPLALLLSLIARRVADGNAVYAWMYFYNWDWTLFQQRAFWIILRSTSAEVLPHILVLLCLAWTVGIVLGTLSRQRLALNGVLFGAVLLLGTYMYARSAGDGEPSLALYHVTFQLGLVLLPAFWGMVRGIGKSLHWVPAFAGMALLSSMHGRQSHDTMPPLLLYVFAGLIGYMAWQRIRRTRNVHFNQSAAISRGASGDSGSRRGGR
jgi:hypothetical protein